MVAQHQTAPKIIRRKQVEARTGLPRSSIYEQQKNGTFPQPINLGPRAVGWVESEIDEWIEERIQKSRKAGGQS
jgi:prophage regulatory protein